MFKIDQLLWIWLPLAIAFFELLATFFISQKSKSLSNSIFSICIAVLNGLAVYILMEILLGGWPVYYPHFLIFISGILLFILFLNSRREVLN